VKPDSSGMDARKTYAPMQHAFLLSAVPLLMHSVVSVFS
jgi:hypothetical protein